MSKLGLATRGGSTFVRILQFLVSILILGIFSYYLGYLSKHHRFIPRWQKAVEGMSGIAVIYTVFGVFLTCFFGGITFFAFLAVVLDVCFVGVMIAIAILTRDATKKCDPVNNSPIGPGQHQSCELQKAAFAVAVFGAFLFLISAVLQIALSRHHKKEKRFGPSPANNYTSGSGNRKFWARKNRKNHDAELATMSAAGENGGVNGGMHDPAMTGAAMGNGYGGANDKYAHPALTLPNPPVAYAPQGTGYQSTGYTAQQTGVVGGGAGTSVPEMPGSAVHNTGGYVH